MPQSFVYSQRGDLYDMLYFNDKTPELDFLEWLFETTSIETRNHKILDMGAGTGRLLIPLTKKGYKIVGQEPFSAMRDQALKNAQEEKVSIVIEEGSFQTLKVKNEFNFIFSINVTMAYLGEYDEWKNAFNQVANALVPGGYFLVDLMNFYGMIKGYKAPELRKYDVDGKQITVFVNHEIDLKNSRWIHQMNIIIDDGQLVQHYVDEHKLTMISLRELLFHAQQTSLEQVHYFTSYEDRPGEPNEGFRMILVFQKPPVQGY